MKKSLISLLVVTLCVYSKQPMPLTDYSNGTLTYSTKGHIKSKGLDINIKYPENWKISEGKSPSIIQLFRNYKEYNLIIYTLAVSKTRSKEMIAPLSLEEKEHALSREGTVEYVDRAFNDMKAEEYLGNHLKDIQRATKGKTVIDGWPSILLEGEGTDIESQYKTFMMQYIVSYKNMAVILTCLVYKNKNDTPESFKKVTNESRQFFNLIANSMTIR